MSSSTQGKSRRRSRSPVKTFAHPGLEGQSPQTLEDTHLYLNREYTWLNFNWRVLMQAGRKELPILERVKFVAIASNNLDEFFMKRIGGLKQQIGAGVEELSLDGRTPAQQIEECNYLVRRLESKKAMLWKKIHQQLVDIGIRITAWSDLSDKQKRELRRHYINNIFPLVTPQAVDPAHPFPFVSNLSLNLIVSLKYRKADTSLTYARVKVPIGRDVDRFLKCSKEPAYVPLEDVMANNLDLLFPGMRINSVDFFRVTRNAVTEKDEEQAEDLLAMIESELRERRFSPVVRLQTSENLSVEVRDKLVDELGLRTPETDVFATSDMLGMRDLWSIASEDFPEHKLPVHHPVMSPAFTSDRSVFHVMRTEDVQVHHPYESFAGSVERFLAEAALDPQVRAIKMTLYRTSSNSRIIQHLITAAQKGKQVAVVLELKARFDEEANIKWADRLEEVGVHVTYGIVGLKTHCKIILVVRADNDGIRRYAHIGTGNYHEETARLYSDVGLLTCDPDVGADLTELFNYLTTGFKPGRKFEKIIPAPKHLKEALLKKIHQEIEHQKAGSTGHIQFKINALEDSDIVEALYEASKAGVKIDLIVRDTCRLRPGVPGISENVRVISIVGRFLEHMRVYYFRNGGQEEYLIGSADAMRRNLTSRVEVVVPVIQESLQKELRFILDTNLSDQWNAWDMLADGSYVMLCDDEATGSHRKLMEHAESRHARAMRLARRATKTGPPTVL